MIHALSLLAQTTTVCPDRSDACETNLPHVAANSANVQVILQITFGLLAGIAVIIIVVSALRFMLALGDPQSLARFRKSIIYAAVGLAIALSAEVIVTFVLNRI